MLVNQSAEDVNAFDGLCRGRCCHDSDRCGHRNVEIEATVRAARVVVLDIAGEQSLQVVTVPDQRPVQTLGPDPAYPPLGIRIRPWCPRRDLDRLDADRGEYLIEHGRELRVSIADQKPQPAGAFDGT
jgi:hypothetical protein